MAKIENTTVYPTVTPAADDLLIATDVSDDNRTVTFLVSSLTGGAGVNQGLQSVLNTGNSATGSIELTGNITLLGGPNTGFIDLCQIKLGGTYGTAGQVLTSQGAGACATWETPSAASCCNLSGTLTAGNTATNDISLTGLGTFAGAGGGVAITTGGTLTTETSVVSTFGGDVILGTTLNFGGTTTLNDSTGSTGTAGAVLTVGAGGYPVWGTLPVPSTPNLQQVLTVGNTATGLGIQLTATSPLSLDATSNIVSAGTNTFSGNNTFSANGTTLSTAGISLTGTLYAGGSVGTAGQVLTSTGTGVQWSSSAGVTSVIESLGTSTGTPATISPTTGNVNIQFNAYAGGSNVGHVPLGGTLGTFLQGDGSWASIPLQNLSSVLNEGNTAANSITLTGASNSITAYTGIFTALQDSGGSTGAASNVIVADGAGGWAWGSPASGAVTSVSTAASGTSSGSPLTITPTTGAVTVASNAYAGTTNVGHVPAGGSATTFLRGDGTWVTPTPGASATDSLVITQKFAGSGVYASGGPYTFMGLDQTGFNLGTESIENALPNLPGAGSFSHVDHIAGFFFQNPNAGTCTSAVDDLTMCSIDVNFYATLTGDYDISIYSGNPCDPDSTFTLVGSCAIVVASAVIYCCSMTVRADSLPAGEGLFLVVTPPNTELENRFMGRISIKFTSN